MAMVVAVVCFALISVPLVALLAVRLTSNQFVRETEQSLIQQGAIYAEIFAETFAAKGGPAIGTPLDETQKKHWNADLHPARSQLNIRADRVLEPRPDGVFLAKPVDARYVAIRSSLIEVARGARRTTLSGIVFLDHTGRDLNTDGAPSLAMLEEVQTSLRGEIGAALRSRGDDYERHAFASLSRDTGFRVFVTYPVILDDRVIGAIYLSRTPLNLGKFLFQERYALMTMLVSTFVGAALIGLLLLRLISSPIYALRDASRAVAAERTPEATPLVHYGVRELAELGDSVSSMAGTLSKRSQDMSTYTNHVTHELKSPVTAIIGAAELLHDPGLDAENRTKLLNNIETEGRRMDRLLSRLRETTRMRPGRVSAPGKLAQMVPDLDGLSVELDATPDATLPVSQEQGEMMLLHFAQNALSHGAGVLRLSYADRVLRISDDGDGIAATDIARVTEPFFTTRRDQGGTGMGLSIVSAILENHDATLECLPSETGALFEIQFSSRPYHA